MFDVLFIIVCIIWLLAMAGYILMRYRELKVMRTVECECDYKELNFFDVLAVVFFFEMIAILALGFV